jgi:acylphosphatase
MKRRAVIKIYGEVQGVGYRSWTLRRARKLGLTGFVRNEPDGSVLIVAEGEEEDIKKLINECRRGPPLARVERVEVEWQEFRGEYGDFEIEYREYELPR